MTTFYINRTPVPDTEENRRDRELMPPPPPRPPEPCRMKSAYVLANIETALRTIGQKKASENMTLHEAVLIWQAYRLY